MLANKLKLNSDKTEILVFSSCYCPRPTLNNLVIASETVDCSTTAKNIGVIFNNSLLMFPHVTAVCKSSFFHLQNIFKIGKFLSYDTCKILIHVFITSRIDYCNSLLYGQPKCILQRLQSVLNSAARLIHLSSRYEHVTPLLIQLQRITFKIAIITFKGLHVSASDTPSRSLQSSNQWRLVLNNGRSFCLEYPSLGTQIVSCSVVQKKECII